ncbi:carbohydrate kinase family protein [Lactonifactor longoviformis]|uniref:Sugar or nucleoside kinase, ribokinase family n=1 Tax=Lactonifactor longoviformis DSM 17459 TaxID=1122155 RepID=A0A1M4V4U8_9CLOT|nr:carbohydrate kinase family protein [Lactonifactor longoviformis]POP32038.1 carbohydrate kinase family protein [Lactonifactor longoviformis]SHE63940.1 Sugar or nucleoside kinase, ribokinase family [Lactonifactor longoviformis DSM 17459]
MEYVVVSTAVMDDMTLADGTYMGKLLGGAGIYALCGAKLWTDQVILVTGTGQDLYDRHKSWFEKNQLSTEGITIKSEYSPISILQYQENGERTETPLYGAEHYQWMEAVPREIEPHCRDAKGVYIFKGTDSGYWNEILDLKKQYGFRILWELNGDYACPQYANAVRSIAEGIDVFSINAAEAKRLFGCEEAEAVERLRSMGVPLVYYRRGSKGAYMITSREIQDVPGVQNLAVIDSTGGGNSSSAGVLYGYCEGLGPKECGILGSISAASCITQYAVPENIDDGLRRNAERLRRQMMEE